MQGIPSLVRTVDMADEGGPLLYRPLLLPAPQAMQIGGKEPLAPRHRRKRKDDEITINSGGSTGGAQFALTQTSGGRGGGAQFDLEDSAFPPLPGK